jgi:hypothetical protein
MVAIGRAAVDHSIGQYAVGAIHTNTNEGFWSLLKRGSAWSWGRLHEARTFQLLLQARF